MKPIRGLKFAVSEIRASEGAAQDLNLAPAEVSEPGSGALLAGPVRMRVEFSLGGNSILLQARMQGAWRMACSRCLVEHEAAFAAELDETFPLTSETIDISEDVRQAVLLELPQRSLCRPECRGLCPRCGKNLNDGPCACPARQSAPFDVLKKITKNKDL